MSELDFRAAAAVAARRYRVIGRWAEGFAKGKMSADPAFARVVTLLPARGALVDVGCGEGYLLALTRALRPEVTLFGLDHDDARLAQGRAALADEPDLTLVCGDLRDATLPRADVVCCLDVLHYMPEDQQDAALVAFAEALRPGGTLLLRDAEAGAGLRTTLTRISETLAVAAGRHKGDGVFFRTAAATRAVLERCGLEVEVVPCRDGTPFANVLFVARKAEAR
ncbi:MAG: class I SAM-dependent methyltransferase [Alphaproteobacteria bacterium]|nr:class I SAM-dependent methyltransferase [Alphaproteobacteria bacterium]